MRINRLFVFATGRCGFVGSKGWVLRYYRSFDTTLRSSALAGEFQYPQ
jgi:hypothetical protein